MNKKVIIWVAFVVVLLIATVKCQKSTSQEDVSEQVVVSEEIVVNETAISVTTTVDDFIMLSGSLLFAHDQTELSDDSKAIIDERIAKYQST